MTTPLFSDRDREERRGPCFRCATSWVRCQQAPVRCCDDCGHQDGNTHPTLLEAA